MKYLIIVFSMLIPQAVLADNEPVEPIQKVEETSVFKGLMYKVWNRFRALSPKKEQRSPGKTSVATAGIRGAETTASILQPYWKDDRSSDPDFLGELNEFADAQALVDKGELKQAGDAFKNFIDNYPDSDLRPNAQFAIGMTYGGMGQAREGMHAFRSFINEYPAHPLAADARLVMESLE